MKNNSSVDTGYVTSAVSVMYVKYTSFGGAATVARLHRGLFFKGALCAKGECI